MKNFWYHYKGHTIIGTIAFLIIAYLTINTITSNSSEQYDVNLMVSFSYYSPVQEVVQAQFAPYSDLAILAINMPLALDREDKDNFDYQNYSIGRMAVASEVASGNTALYLFDNDSGEIHFSDETHLRFTEFTQYFPEIDFRDATRLYLSDTVMNGSETFPEDAYFCLLKESEASEKEFENALELLKSLIP